MPTATALCSAEGGVAIHGVKACLFCSLQPAESLMEGGLVLTEDVGGVLPVGESAGGLAAGEVLTVRGEVAPGDGRQHVVVPRVDDRVPEHHHRRYLRRRLVCSRSQSSNTFKQQQQQQRKYERERNRALVLHPC